MQCIVWQGNRTFRKCGYQKAVYDQKYFLIPSAPYIFRLDTCKIGHYV